MIRLRTLGESAIEIGDVRIGPDSSVLFALLLYLCLERGRPVSRVRLRELLWPNVPEHRAWHSLRQLLYRIRQLGVGLESRGGHVRLTAGVELDFETVIRRVTTRPAADADDLFPIVPFLDRYEPPFSELLRGWVEQTRATVHARVRHALLGALMRCRENGDWSTVTAFAHGILALDPLNEEATLSLAEQLALAGSKVEAVAVIDRYATEVGRANTQGLAIAPSVLRRRIAERLPDTPPPRALGTPFVGRGDTIAYFHRVIQEVVGGRSACCHVWGPAGIGKSRLVDEVSRAGVLYGLTVERVECRDSGRVRPLSVFVDLVPRLLRLRGALGCAPDSMAALDRLRVPAPSATAATVRPGEADFIAADIRNALFDLLDAVCSENKLMLVIEDAHLADERSTALLAEASDWAGHRPLLLVLTSREISKLSSKSIAETRLRPLDAVELSSLATSHPSLGQVRLDSQDIARLIQLSEGNPFYAHELLSHWLSAGTLTGFPRSLAILIAQRLRQLTPASLLTLQTLALLDRDATVNRVEIALALPTHALVSAINELETAGLVSASAGGLACAHDIVAEAAASGLGPLAAAAIHRAIAAALELEARQADSAAYVWECARHWQLGGNPERAVDFGVRCATHLLSLGLPGEAADILDKLRPLAPSRGHLAKLLQIRGHAHYQALEWNGVQQTLLERMSILQQVRGPLAPHDAEELMLLEASWRSDPPSFDEILAGGMRCVTEKTASRTHRLTAAVECMKIAGNLCDRTTTAALFQEVESVVPNGPTELLLWAEAEMVFHTLFGDVTKGALAAISLVEMRRAHPAPGALFGCLLNAASPLLFDGREAEAECALLEALSIAADYRLRSATFLVYDSLVALKLRVDDVDGARHWFSEGAACSWGENPLHRVTFDASGVEIALACGRTGDAQCLWNRISGTVMPARFPRGVAALLAVKLQMQVAMNDNAIPECDIQSLLALHLKMRGLGGHDRVTAALLQALTALEKTDAARELYNEYLTKHRRERYPPTRVLRDLGRRLQ